MGTEQKDRTLFVFTALLIIVHIAGLIGILSPYQHLFIQLTPLNLLLSITLLLYNHKQFNKTFILFCSIVFLSGFLIEVLGVKSGLIFGHYSYGNTLGFKLLGVPLVIGINWLMLIYSAGVICERINTNIFFKSTIGAIMLVALDFSIEPIAIKYDFWSWELLAAQNYIAWFVVSFLLLLIFHSLQFNKNNKLAQALYIIQLVFFTLLNIF